MSKPSGAMTPPRSTPPAPRAPSSPGRFRPLRHLAAALGLCLGALASSALAQSPPRARTLAANAPVAPVVLSSTSTTRPRSQMVPFAPREQLLQAVLYGSSDDMAAPLRPPPEARRGAGARRQPGRLCLRPAVDIRRVRNGNSPRWVGSLTDCSGRPTMRAMAMLALLAQPGRPPERDREAAVVTLRRLAPAAGWSLADEVAVPRWRQRVRAQSVTIPREHHGRDPIVEVAPGARALHPRLLQLLQAVVDHFPGHPIEIISGYRPGEGTSRHAHARALDFRLRGVPYEELRDFARTLPQAGVGYYPNSVFVHLDVRDTDEGGAFWTDYSGPGETPRYGHWPPTDQDIQSEVDYLVTRNENELERAREVEWSPEALRGQRPVVPPSSAPRIPWRVGTPDAEDTAPEGESEP